MAIPADVWLDVMQREYFADFIRDGGGAVRFAVADAAVGITGTELVSSGKGFA